MLEKGLTWEEMRLRLNQEGEGYTIGKGCFSSLIGQLHLRPEKYYKDKSGNYIGKYHEKDFEKIKKLVEKKGWRKYNKKTIPPSIEVTPAD